MKITTGNGNDNVIRPVQNNGKVFRSNDTINTGAGNDTINAGLGKRDYVYGGAGIDHLIVDYSVGDTGGGMFFNSTYGRTGTAYRTSGVPNTRRLDYTFFKDIEQFTVIGTSKDDTIKVYFGAKEIQAGAGNDRVIGNSGTIDGGSGFDYLTLDLSKQTSNLNLSNLSNINLPGIVTATNFERFSITTGNGNDIVTQSGTLDGTVLRANDTIKTGDGDDIINAGLGDDYVRGGKGSDRLILDYSAGDTGTGMRFYAGKSSGSAVRSVSSTDSTRLDDIFFSRIEHFTVIGTSKDDSIRIFAIGNDVINAGAGNDTIKVGAGDDNINGGAGNDTIDGGSGNDTLLGGSGDDILIGGSGNDVLTGGGNKDSFLYENSYAFKSATFGIDSITDFTTLSDKIVLDKSTFRALESDLGNGFSIGNEFAIVDNDAAAATSAAKIVYNQGSGDIFYNENGTEDGFGTGAQFIELTDNPLLSASDFVIKA